MSKEQLGRRSFLRKSTILGIGGITSLTATTDNASAASTQVTADGHGNNSGCRYVIKNGNGRFYEKENINPADYAGDRVVGTLGSGYDMYTSTTGLTGITYINIAGGLNASDPKIHFDLDKTDGSYGPLYFAYVSGDIGEDQDGQQAKWDYTVVDKNGNSKSGTAWSSSDSLKFQNPIRSVIASRQFKDVGATVDMV